MIAGERPCIPVSQPIGTFYLTSLSAALLVRSLKIDARKDEPGPDGQQNQDVQREPSQKRIRDIATYITDPDATFPTAIIISCDSERTRILNGERIVFSTSVEAPHIGELLDGQHRIKGLRLAEENGVDIQSFELPVVVMMDLEVAEKAYIFSIINSKQTPVSKSLIYDLFGLSTERSPYLTCHKIARALNTDPESPFYLGLKMLGRRKLPTEMLTQGSFVKSLLRLITSTPDADAIALKADKLPKESSRPFNAFFGNRKDELILKTMKNYFMAIATVFSDDWRVSSYVDSEGKPLNKPTPVLRRTVGYEGLMRALEGIWPEVKADGTLSEEFFLTKAKLFKRNAEGTLLTTEYFGSSSADAGLLANLFLTGSKTK